MERIWINPAHDSAELRNLIKQQYPNAQIMGRAPRAAFSTELTDIGEQFVIPGCERQPNPGTKAAQPDLWDAAGRRDAKDGR